MTSTTRRARMMVLSLGTLGLLIGAAAPVRADDDDWRRHEWREHERREHEWRKHQAWCAHHPYACGQPPGYVYAPPPVTYVAPPPPPPVVYAPPPSLEIIVPFHIR